MTTANTDTAAPAPAFVESNPEIMSRLSKLFPMPEIGTVDNKTDLPGVHYVSQIKFGKRLGDDGKPTTGIMVLVKDNDPGNPHRLNVRIPAEKVPVLNAIGAVGARVKAAKVYRASRPVLDPASGKTTFVPMEPIAGLFGDPTKGQKQVELICHSVFADIEPDAIEFTKGVSAKAKVADAFEAAAKRLNAVSADEAAPDVG